MFGQLWHSFQEGGWAMWPIFALGVLGISAAGRFAWRGEHQLLGFVRWITLTVIACGWFGFFIDMQAVLTAVVYKVSDPPWDKQGMVLLEGTKESLNCLSGSLLFVVVIVLLGAIGHRRFPLPNPAAVPR
jgi:hypothetical protein